MLSTHMSILPKGKYFHFYLIIELEILRKPLEYYFTSSCNNSDHRPILHPPSFPTDASPAWLSRLCGRPPAPPSPPAPSFTHSPERLVFSGTHCSVFFFHLLALDNLMLDQGASATKFTKPLFHSYFVHSFHKHVLGPNCVVGTLGIQEDQKQM